MKNISNSDEGDNNAPSLPSMNDVFLQHVDIYAVADFYGIRELRIHSQQSFLDVARCGFQTQDFDKLVKRIYEIKLGGSDSITFRTRICDYAFRKCEAFPALMGELSGDQDLKAFVQDVFETLLHPQKESKAKIKMMVPEDANKSKIALTDEDLARLDHINFSKKKCGLQETRS